LSIHLFLAAAAAAAVQGQASDPLAPLPAQPSVSPLPVLVPVPGTEQTQPTVTSEPVAQGPVTVVPPVIAPPPTTPVVAVRVPRNYGEIFSAIRGGRWAEAQIGIATLPQGVLTPVAKAELYPSFSIFGTIGLQANTTSSATSDLFSTGSLVYSVGPRITWPFFNYGRLTNNVRVEDPELQPSASDLVAGSWLVLRRGKIDMFRTVMTGELFSLLKEHSILSDLLQGEVEPNDVFKEAANKQGLADRTYKDKLTLFRGKEEVELRYFGAAHTDGDSFVVFKSARVMHSGDAFANKGQPFIDRANGGSGVAYPATLKKAAREIKNVDKVITGHSPVMTFQDFVDAGDFNQLMLDHARAALGQNKTPEQALKEFTLPESFKAKGFTAPGPGRGGAGGNFAVLFEELKTAK